MLPMQPAAAAPRSCALVATALRSADESASTDPAGALETLTVCAHSMRALCAAHQCRAPPDPLPPDACVSIQEGGVVAGSAQGPQARRLLATGRSQDASAAQAELRRLDSGTVDRCVLPPGSRVDACVAVR